MKMFNRRYYLECWLSLADVENIWDIQFPPVKSIIPAFLDESLWFSLIKDFKNDLINNYPFFDKTNSKVATPVKEILNLVMKRYWNHYCFAISNQEAEEAREEATKFLIKLLNVIEHTYERYGTLLNLYASNKADLMKKLESVSENGTIFSDTPQDDEVDIDEINPKIATTLTQGKSKVSSDSNTPIMKLKEIERNYSDVLLNWVNEFDSLFIEENNI